MEILSGNKTDELWDLYTDERVKTGQQHCRGEQVPQGRYHIAVHVCIFNSRNQLLIQQRQPFKQQWPNMWDLSAAGSALAGENSCQAAMRETFEELGLKLDLTGMRPCFTWNFSTGFDDYYIVEQDVDISKLRLQEEEVKQVRWADKEEVLAMQAQGTMIPYWFADKLFEIRKTYDASGERLHKMWVGPASMKHLETWVSLADVVKGDYPWMETEGQICVCREKVIPEIEQGNAVIALDGSMAVGILLFTERKKSVLEYGIRCAAVHPDYRRKYVATQMFQFMAKQVVPGSDITVEVLHGNENKGAAAMSFYKSVGFVPGKMRTEDGSTVQIFVRKGTGGRKGPDGNILDGRRDLHEIEHGTPFVLGGKA